MLDAETVPFIDVTASAMLIDLHGSLLDDGVELVLAQELGEVRDVLPADGTDAPFRVYRTVAAAVDALQARFGGT